MFTDRLNEVHAFAASIFAGARGRRTVAIGAVLVVHAVFVLVLIAGIRVPHAGRPEVSIALAGGPLGSERATPDLPDLAKPQEVEPPVIDIQAPAPAEAVASAPGSPLVTRPAMAIAEAHGFPPLPSVYASRRAIVLRVVLSIARDGSIAGAEIAQTSGIAALDRLAIDWVKQHWRYQPALENGEAIAATDIAVVTFR